MVIIIKMMNLIILPILQQYHTHTHMHTKNYTLKNYLAKAYIRKQSLEGVAVTCSRFYTRKEVFKTPM